VFKQISDNEIYLLIKYIKNVLWRVAKRLSYIEDARCLKVNMHVIIDKFQGLLSSKLYGNSFYIYLNGIYLWNEFLHFCNWGFLYFWVWGTFTG